MRRALRKVSVVAHSTIILPGRSQRLQTIAVLALTSPLATPDARTGRAFSGLTIPSTCAHARRGSRLEPSTPPRAAPANARLLIVLRHRSPVPGMAGIITEG